MFRGHFWKSFLCKYRWYRRWYGGVWEKWYIDHPVCSVTWLDVVRPTKEAGARPCTLCRGTPEVEDYRGGTVENNDNTRLLFVRLVKDMRKNPHKWTCFHSTTKKHNGGNRNRLDTLADLTVQSGFMLQHEIDEYSWVKVSVAPFYGDQIGDVKVTMGHSGESEVFFPSEDLDMLIHTVREVVQENAQRLGDEKAARAEKLVDTFLTKFDPNQK